jgi:hypothetical protein
MLAPAAIMVKGSMLVKTIKKRRMRTNARSRSLSMVVVEVVIYGDGGGCDSGGD